MFFDFEKKTLKRFRKRTCTGARCNAAKCITQHLITQFSITGSQHRYFTNVKHLAQKCGQETKYMNSFWRIED